MMRLLLDENCSNLKEILFEMGWEVLTICDAIERKAGTKSVSDEEILAYAKKNKTIIVTKDQGLKLLCYKESVPFISLGSPREEALLVDNKLKEMQAWKEYL
jgi:predicted nuclease of predicted toxin-antitoxin system